ncbi:MAG TPA: patatin-like phospholipase family protein, partial [Pyrinomonadaceae bacterium]|nr:patatin-like phospholipase family protein [Pyrinomonadaceae bacterium]
MKMRLILTAAAIAFLVIPVPALGQSAATRNRPTVGLVLSGGGARGFAHIGVLKVLEANRVPVDYIGGASMGGLVGALYAMGKTPDEIESTILALDWDKLFQTSGSSEDLSFRRKEDRRNIPAPIVLKGNIRDLKLPNALNSGHQIGLLIDHLTLPYAKVNDFSEMPIPFGVVGTDMVKGESVQLVNGSLSRSLRATMSVPGIFAPVELDGRILSDGGLVNNIPTDIVKAMGADVVLVVNIETQLGGRDALQSLPGILAQTINIATVDNSRRSLREADIIISPDLGKHSSSDFESARAIIDLGFNGALERAALLRPLSVNEAEWQQHLAARRRRVLPETPPVPDTVAVDIKDEDTSQLIKEKLGDKYNGQALDDAKLAELEKDLSQLTGSGRFESLDYRLTGENGKTELVIGSNSPAITVKKPTRLELGFDVNSVDADSVNFNFLARLTFFDIGKHGSEWRNDLRLGSNGLFATEYYRPLGQTKFFVAPRAFYERRRLNVFLEQDRIAEYVAQTAEIGADIGYNFSSRSELRAGYAFGYQSLSRRIGDPLFANLNGFTSGASIKWNYDDLDRAQVPTRGVLARSRLSYFFHSPDTDGGYAQAETRVFAFRPQGKRNVLLAFGGAGTSFGSTPSPFHEFTLGGPFRLGGYGFEELRGNSYAQAGAGLLHNPSIIPEFLGGRTYIGAWYEGGSVFTTSGRGNYRQSVTGGIAFETPIGPVFVGTSINENARGRFYFS